MSATAIRCTVCGGATGVRADAVRQRCELCGSEFLWEPTQRAAGESERRVRAAIDRIQPELDALDAAARQHAAAGDLDGAYRYAAEHVQRVGAIYEQAGYYRLMGADTPEAIERNRQFAFHLHLQHLGLAAAPAAPDPPASTPHARMVEGMSKMSFEMALEGYKAMIAEQLSSDPQWRHRDPAEIEQVRATSIRTFALGLWFATDADLERHGIELSHPVQRPDGTRAVRCVQCGAEVVLERLAETVTCAYCNATFRIRLQGVDLYHAHGYTDVTEADVARQRLGEAVARGDLSARVELARQATAETPARSATHRSELAFAYAMEVGAPLGAADQAAIAARLGLGAPTTCRRCDQVIALGAGTTACPRCFERL